MEELTKEDLTLFFEEDIYLIKEEITSSKLPEVNILEPIKENISTAAPMAEEPNPIPIIEPKLLAYQGENAKGIAIIITNDSNDFLNKTDETLLLNILKAIGLSLADVAIINQHTANTKWVSQIKFSKVIVFGILPSTYGFVTSNYSIQQKEQEQWLFSDSLFSLSSDKVLKGKLWTTLQDFFK